MKLVIVESPAKCSKIESFLGPSYKCVASYGHLRDIPSHNIKWFDPSRQDNIPFQLLPKKEKIVKQLLAWKKKASEVILATDMDREGEAIAFHLMELLDLNPDTTKRILFNEITPQSIQDAIQNPILIRRAFYEAQLARRIIDLLFGYMVSPLLWKSLKQYHLSAGRCQTPCLHFMRQRQTLYENSLPTTTIKGVAFLDDAAGENKLTLETPSSFRNATEVDAFLDILKDISQWRVGAKETKECLQNPPSPFKTSTLQTKCHQLWNWSPSKTLSTAQKLYENGLITYMRTDSQHISKHFAEQAKSYIKKTYGDPYLCSSSFQQKRKHHQDAHECIRPTSITPPSTSSAAGSDLSKLYSLIWKTTVASLMAPLVEDRCIYQIVPLFSHETISWKYTESKPRFLGFQTLFLASSSLPPVTLKNWEKDRVINLAAFCFEESIHRSELPYTSSGIISMLEEKGIGRPSTYHLILEKLVEKTYILNDQWAPTKHDLFRCDVKAGPPRKIKKSYKAYEMKTSGFQVTSVGKSVDDFLSQRFQPFMTEEFTKELEEKLDQITTGERFFWSVVQEFHKQLSSLIHQESLSPDTNVPAKIDTGIILDHLDQEPIYLKRGPFGFYVSWKDKTAAYKKGMKIQTIKEKLTEVQQKRILSTSVSLVKKGDNPPFIMILPKTSLKKKTPPVFVSYDFKKLPPFEEVTLEEIQKYVYETKKVAC